MSENKGSSDAIVPRLSDHEEHLAINWQTVRLTAATQALKRLAMVMQTSKLFPASD
jgi:hypothetical protein